MSPACPGSTFKVARSGALDFLLFQFGGERFAVDMARVLECVHYRDLTAVMDGPRRVPGVVIWRGMILPWIDLRAGWCDTTTTTAMEETAGAVAAVSSGYRLWRFDCARRRYGVDGFDPAGGDDMQMSGANSD